MKFVLKTAMDKKASLRFFVRNLTKESFVEAIFDTVFDTDGPAPYLTFEAERSFGVRLSLNY